MLYLGGADMDIDLVTHKFGDNECPWSKEDGIEHKCAVKGTSICPHFNGIAGLDTVQCSYEDDKTK